MNFKLDITTRRPWMLGTIPVPQPDWDEAGKERRDFLVREFREDWSKSFNAWLRSKDVEHFVLARELGISSTTTNLWIKGRALPKPELIEELEKLLETM